MKSINILLMLRSVNTRVKKRVELMVMKISLRLKKMKLDLRKSMVGPNRLLKATFTEERVEILLAGTTQTTIKSIFSAKD